MYEYHHLIREIQSIGKYLAQGLKAYYIRSGLLYMITCNLVFVLGVKKVHSISLYKVRLESSANGQVGI